MLPLNYKYDVPDLSDQVSSAPRVHFSTPFHGYGSAGTSGGSSASVNVDPMQIDSTGSYVDDGSNTSAEKARDDNLGILNQLIGSLSGENQRILQDLMSAATKAQYDYSERMSSTAYQRAVSDMRKAGLNPAVLFANGQGSAASTPQVGISQVATENQLVSMLSSSSKLVDGMVRAVAGAIAAAIALL